ncbi:hypothetical protein F5144DRAFT_621488 [Chaetomium tenue]|uniref:Uncharacterized protein n=1 Tax=Chaetomium tenue TaxID=1854479 RepID=A0ACB7P9R1_9PEZI|nr:hypothetical protein F5144DRAFT_621488 [Chaetomium globosum]
MDRIAELEKQLLAAQAHIARVEEEKARAEEEKARAEQEKSRAEEETRETTLFEYIQACHDLIFANFTVETNKDITSKGSITNPGGRRCPIILGTLFSSFPAQTEAFRSLHYLKTRGQVIGRMRVGDEDALRLVLQDLVAEPVTSIVERFQDEDAVKAEFDIGAGITLKTRVNALAGSSQESAERPRTPDGMKLRPDQICAYRRDDGHSTGTGRTMAYIIEHKAPHKLTLPHLRLGLRPMNIYEEVVNRPTIPVPEETEARFQYNSDRLAAAAVTQTFDYMIQAGLTYGCVTTGEGFVFLKIDWTHPITLLYHLAEPAAEVDEHRDNLHCCTAVSQVLAFTVLALDAQARQEHGQNERWRAMEGLKTGAEDWDTILRSIPLSERAAPPTSPAYRPRNYKGVDRSPYLLRRTRLWAIGERDRRDSFTNRRPSPGSDDGDGGDTQMPDTPTPARPRRSLRDVARRPRGNSSGGGSSSQSGRASQRQYCTQACLLGLVAGGVLDEGCPNVTLHRRADGDRRHPVDHATWLGLLREQLGHTLDDGIMPLGKQGARGVLFQVTLLAHGYTFVSKATTAGFVRELEHEAAVYDRLRPLQGARVPVFLGAVDLREVGRTYYYDIDVRIIYLVLLSCGGRSLDEMELSDAAKVEREAIQSVRALHMHGVVHTDVRDANVLWNEETQRAMRPRPVLASVVPNKRARHTGVDTKATTVSKPRSKSDVVRFKMQEDILYTRSIFDRPS